MFNIFQLKNNYLFRVDDKDIVSSINHAIWVDIIESNNDEFYYIKKIIEQYKINLLKLKYIEENRRFFYDEYGVYIRSFFFLNNDQNKTDSVMVSFMVHNGCLYTLCKIRIPIFYMYQKFLNDHVLIDGNAYELLLGLFELKIDDLINRIEYIYSSLGRISLVIVDNQQIEEYDSILSNIAELENISWKIRINLLDTERVIKSLIRKINLPITQKQYANEILNDIYILLSYNECILQKVNFLTQSVMGLISIEQNRIIKIFSIVFLPPTLIASSYGMNFDFMPELKWSFGYPSAIILMILAGLAPYLYFKHKNWL